MTPNQCPVHETLLELKKIPIDRRVVHPRGRRLIEEIATLVQDIVAGRAGTEHLPCIDARVEELCGFTADPVGVETGQWLFARLAEHAEVFRSHALDRNCTASICDHLTPAPCQMACPAGIDVPTYLSLIALGQDDEAIEVIRRDNPLPWVCGLVCTRPCELMCVRGRIDTPISIKFLKAFAAERAMSWGRHHNPQKAAATGRKVCVIGAGPGGLAAAYYLALQGHTVRVLEALPRAGGMILVGIPRYRLPSDIIDREVAKIEDLGVEFQFNTRFGRDVDLDGLRAEGFEAFFFAVGAHASFNLGVEGENDFPQVQGAVDLLQRVALGERRCPGKNVVVIGGGNVAIDAARTCLRLGSEQVTIAYRRTRKEMPADLEEVEQAEEEGVHFELLTVPVAVTGEGGNVCALRCLKAKLVTVSGSSRQSPKPIEGSDYDIPADAIISAIGQRVEQHWFKSMPDLTWTHRDTIRVNTITMETSLPGIFAAGDAVTGPATVIEAIGGGKRAATAMGRYLTGIPQPKLPPVPVRHQRVPCFDVPAHTKMALKRPEMPLLGIDRRRTTFQQVELGYSENQTREEARRCLRCDICRRCGKCVTVCKEKMGVDALALGYLSFDHPEESDFRRTEQRCISCGACAANCPTGAMRIEDRGPDRILSLCGTILNRQPLVFCSSCGTVIGTERYLAFIRGRLGGLAAKAAANEPQCEICARKKGHQRGTTIMAIE
ncbi:MAG: FAD-dependent oxidoreductase [Proteobacteria bacterium]|nr:FAD-dependent oxidoreductase [Pseudomonadota bacterium]